MNANSWAVVAEDFAPWNVNGFGLRTDHHGDSASTATPITTAASTSPGLISTRGDRDTFVFSTTGGAVSFTATPAPTGPNLDIELTIRDASGSVVATTLNATLSSTLAAGTYTVEVDGRCIGQPATSPPTGYTDDGSLGQYSLDASIDGPGPEDNDPPAAPTGLRQPPMVQRSI